MWRWWCAYLIHEAEWLAKPNAGIAILVLNEFYPCILQSAPKVGKRAIVRFFVAPALKLTQCREWNSGPFGEIMLPPPEQFACFANLDCSERRSSQTGH